MEETQTANQSGHIGSKIWQQAKVMAAGFSTIIQKISIRWTLLSLVFFLIFLFWLFPYNQTALFFVHKYASQAGWNVQTQKFAFHFPIIFQAEQMSFKPSTAASRMEADMFDFKAVISPSLIWNQTGHIQFHIPGLRIQQDHIFVRTNLTMHLEFDSLNKSMSQTSGSIQIQANQLDFSDIIKLLQNNQQAQAFVSILGEKIPKTLHFSQIQINGKLAKKRFSIEKGSVNGKEIIASITGYIDIQQEKMGLSRLFLDINISRKSPIWTELATEKSLLQSMGFLNAQGDLRLPIRGSLAKPVFSMPRQQKKLPGMQ